MIHLNIENIKNINFKQQVLSWQNKVDKIHKGFIAKKLPGYEMTDWANWPINYFKDELDEMLSKVRSLQDNGVETLLVIGIGGSYLGAKSGIDFIKGSIKMQDKVIFAGLNFSASLILQIEEKLKNKKWAIVVISKSGTTLEPAIAFRHFRTILEKKEGENANNLIVAITDGEKGTLHDIAIKKKYKLFVIPSGIGGRFSGITPVGLFPMAFVGIDIKKILMGASEARDKFLKTSNLKSNTAYQYAVLRHFMGLKRFNFYPTLSFKNTPLLCVPKLQNRKSKEIFVSYETDLEMTLEWLKQLYGESEGKTDKALFPTSASYSKDLHSLGQIIQEGNKDFFETVILIKNNGEDIKINRSVINDDNLNYVSGKTFNQLNKIVFKSVTKAHNINGKIPIIVIEIDDRSEKTLGYLWYFFFMSVMMSGYLLKINPFNQPGVEVYKKRLFDNL